MKSKIGGNSKPSICLTTYYTKNIHQLGELCLASLKVYAEKFNIDLKLYNDLTSKRPPAWNKILVVKKLLNEYEYVLWVDADAVIVRFDKDIRYEMEPEKYLYLVKFNLEKREMPNFGVFLIKRSEWSKNFLDHVWGMKQYIYHAYWENAAVMDELGYKNQMVYNTWIHRLNILLYKTGTKNLTRRITDRNLFRKVYFRIFSKAGGPHEEKLLTSGAAPREEPKEVKWLSPEWNSATGIYEVVNPIIKHYPGRPYKERLRQMAEALERAGVRF